MEMARFDNTSSDTDDTQLNYLPETAKGEG